MPRFSSDADFLRFTTHNTLLPLPAADVSSSLDFALIFSLHAYRLIAADYATSCLLRITPIFIYFLRAATLYFCCAFDAFFFSPLY